MKIAQVAPLYESVPPQAYGGTERVVSYLTEELVRQGHDVTLFASADSGTSARLISGGHRSLRLDNDCLDQTAHHFVMLEEVFRRAGEFDLIHFHVDYLHFPWSRRSDVRQLTTLHGRLDIADLQPLYEEYPEMPVVSISASQRGPLPWLNWIGTVYHGLPPELHTCGEESGGYLSFLGRISPEKRLDLAIEIAGRTGLPLKIGAKVDKADQEYFDTVIRPLLAQPGVEFLGEVNEQEKGRLLRGARALLFPIDWPEPFGLVMIEAMACGTPTIAFRRGSVPEVMVDGRSGFICDTVDEAVAAVRRLDEVPRREVRRVFEERYTAERMAHDYVKIYEQLAEGRTDDTRGAGTLLYSGYGASGG